MPDNAIYYQLAYAATIVIYVGYGVVLWRRSKALDARERR
jgi:hypothetical protein